MPRLALARHVKAIDGPRLAQRRLVAHAEHRAPEPWPSPCASEALAWAGYLLVGFGVVTSSPASWNLGSDPIINSWAVWRRQRFGEEVGEGDWPNDD